MFSRVSQRIKVFCEKLVWLFKNNAWYKRWICFIFIFSFWLVFYWFIDWILGWNIVLEDIFDIYWCILFGSFIASFIFLFFTIVLTSLLFPKGSVDPNISELPKDINGNKVIVEYTPPKWLGPSEVWIIYSLWYDWTNLSCLIYKWLSEWLIVREVDKTYWTYIIRRVWQPEYTTPSYERFFRSYVFARNNTDHAFEDYINKSWENIMDSQQALVDYCVGQWYLIQKNKCRKLSYSHNFLLFIVFVFCPLLWILLHILSLSSSNSEAWYKINLWKLSRTKKWNELYAKILWYKYFLEHCDEEKMKEVLKQDPEYIDKTLPYIIALRLNWKFLDRSYLK